MTPTSSPVSLALGLWSHEQWSWVRNPTGLGEKELEDPSNFPCSSLTVPFSLIYFLKGCTKTCASSWRVMGLVVGKGGLGALWATATDEYETAVLKFLSHFDQVSVCFWRTCGLSYCLSIVKSRLFPVLCLSCTEEGLFWEDIWQRSQETRL